MVKARPQSLIPIERIATQIYSLRRQKVMLDFDLAKLYGVSTRALNQAVTRNREQFPEDFMFQLSKEEFEYLRSQIVISSWGGRRYPPRAFTQEGIAMLSGVLRSKRAVEVNIDIMRAFVRLRQTLDTNEELAAKWPSTIRRSPLSSSTSMVCWSRLNRPPNPGSAFERKMWMMIASSAW